jgi:hypothetical protein
MNWTEDDNAKPVSVCLRLDESGGRGPDRLDYTVSYALATGDYRTGDRHRSHGALFGHAGAVRK